MQILYNSQTLFKNESTKENFKGVSNRRKLRHKQITVIMTYSIKFNIGKADYVISFNDGKNNRQRLFKNKLLFNNCLNAMKREGYKLAY